MRFTSILVPANQGVLLFFPHAGSVRMVVLRETGVHYACKSIRKVLGDGYSENKRSTHLESVKREVRPRKRCAAPVTPT